MNTLQTMKRTIDNVTDAEMPDSKVVKMSIRFEDLPDEILNTIMSYIGVRNMYNLSVTCSKVCSMAQLYMLKDGTEGHIIYLLKTDSEFVTKLLGLDRVWDNVCDFELLYCSTVRHGVKFTTFDAKRILGRCKFDARVRMFVQAGIYNDVTMVKIAMNGGHIYNRAVAVSFIDIDKEVALAMLRKVYPDGMPLDEQRIIYRMCKTRVKGRDHRRREIFDAYRFHDMFKELIESSILQFAIKAVKCGRTHAAFKMLNTLECVHTTLDLRIMHLISLAEESLMTDVLDVICERIIFREGTQFKFKPLNPRFTHFPKYTMGKYLKHPSTVLDRDIFKKRGRALFLLKYGNLFQMVVDHPTFDPDPDDIGCILCDAVKEPSLTRYMSLLKYDIFKNCPLPYS